ncbi:MAG TPA: YggS family pyridoxal phosphate-dependent enzyme [Actinomycetota bacterium]|nr:YggS family pyridoxal phosphate-dependent enzyme [Actinomycetota bacterium]
MRSDAPTADRIRANVAALRRGIEEACARSGRDPATVRLVAASKTVPAEGIRAAWEAGVREFGENYVRELRDKREAAPEAVWHFIGTLQSHTAHHVADLADVVQTLAPGRAFARLGRRAAARGRRLRALIEVDFAGRGTGVTPQACDAFADEVAATQGVELAGLMTLPPETGSPEEARPYFRRLRELLERVAGRHPGAVELSMGMSMDYQVAVEEGATMVRIGTALFGERPSA